MHCKQISVNVLAYHLFGIFVTHGAPDGPTPEEKVRNKLFESEKDAGLDVKFLTTGGCADLAVKYQHHPGAGPNHIYDELDEENKLRKTGTVLEVLDDFSKCLQQLNVLRHEALKAGEESAKWNEKAYTSYRDVVDTAGDLDLDVGLEEAMAKQRKREAAILLKKMREVETKRRNLFSPLWQSVGLWQGFQADPHMDAATRNLPYIGGSAPRTSTIDSLINGLKSSEAVKVKREMDLGLDLTKKINALEAELQSKSKSLTTDDFKEKMRLLVTLKEIQDEQNAQDQHDTIEGIRLKSAGDSTRLDLYHVYIRDFNDIDRRLIWRTGGVEWSKKKAANYFSDLPATDLPQPGSQVTGSQMVRCRKALEGEGRVFSPTLLVGTYFKTEKLANDELENEIQEEKRYRWRNVQGFALTYPKCATISHSIQENADVSPRTILAIKRQSGKDNIMAELVDKEFVYEIDRWGNVKTSSNYYWTAPGVAWCFGPTQKHMFHDIGSTVQVGAAVVSKDYDKLLTIFGDKDTLEKAMCDNKPALLEKSRISTANKQAWELVDVWTETGIYWLTFYDGALRSGGGKYSEWPIKVDELGGGAVGECQKPKVGDLYTKACDALITKILSNSRANMRDNQWLRPEAKLKKDVGEALKQDVLRVFDKSFEDQLKMEEDEARKASEKEAAKNGEISKESVFVLQWHNTAPIHYCGAGQDEITGKITRTKTWKELEEFNPSEHNDWHLLGYGDYLWDSGATLSDEGFKGKKPQSENGKLHWDKVVPKEKAAADRLRWKPEMWDREVERTFPRPTTTSLYCEGLWGAGPVNRSQLGAIEKRNERTQEFMASRKRYEEEQEKIKDARRGSRQQFGRHRGFDHHVRTVPSRQQRGRGREHDWDREEDAHIRQQQHFAPQRPATRQSVAQPYVDPRLQHFQHQPEFDDEFSVSDEYSAEDEHGHHGYHL